MLIDGALSADATCTSLSFPCLIPRWIPPLSSLSPWFALCCGGGGGGGSGGGGGAFFVVMLGVLLLGVLLLFVCVSIELAACCAPCCAPPLILVCVHVCDCFVCEDVDE